MPPEWIYFILLRDGRNLGEKITWRPTRMLPKWFSIFMMLRNPHRNWVSCYCGKHFTDTTKFLTFKRSPIFVMYWCRIYFINFQPCENSDWADNRAVVKQGGNPHIPTTISNLPSPGEWTHIIILHLCWLMCSYLFITWLLFVVTTKQFQQAHSPINESLE